MALTKIKSTGIAANAITETQISVSALANVLIAGDNIIIEANARISSTGGGGGVGGAGEIFNPFFLSGM
jgi:hypothetical protein